MSYATWKNTLKDFGSLIAWNNFIVFVREREVRMNKKLNEAARSFLGFSFGIWVCEVGSGVMGRFGLHLILLLTLDRLLQDELLHELV